MVIFHCYVSLPKGTNMYQHDGFFARRFRCFSAEAQRVLGRCNSVESVRRPSVRVAEDFKPARGVGFKWKRGIGLKHSKTLETTWHNHVMNLNYLFVDAHSPKMLLTHCLNHQKQAMARYPPINVRSEALDLYLQWVWPRLSTTA